MKVIFFSHQSGDFYGSDKVFFKIVTGINKENYFPIVALASDGKLKELLVKNGIETHIIELGKIKRSELSIFGFIRTIKKTFIGMYCIHKIIKTKKIDLFYINTSVIFSPLIYARVFKIPSIWHIHELIETPKLLRSAYASIMRFFATNVIFVSNTTKINYTNVIASLDNISHVVHNPLIISGMDFPSDENYHKIQNQIKSTKKLVISMVGRISPLKGQIIFLQAIKILPKSLLSRIEIFIVGDAASGHEKYFESITEISNQLMKDVRINIFNYCQSPYLIYNNSDVVVVSSIEPESFGLVAIEAMSSGCVVMASNIGSLPEIILDNETGFLFTPGSALSLAEKLEFIIKNSDERERISSNGKMYANINFSEAVFIKKVTHVVESIS